jgi:hypothetical protein
VLLLREQLIPQQQQRPAFQLPVAYQQLTLAVDALIVTSACGACFRCRRDFRWQLLQPVSDVVGNVLPSGLLDKPMGVVWEHLQGCPFAVLPGDFLHHLGGRDAIFSASDHQQRTVDRLRIDPARAVRVERPQSDLARCTP